jgi:hypothetical protein
VKIIFFATKSKKTADRHYLGGIHDRTFESWVNEPYVDVLLINNALGRGQHQKAMPFFLSCSVLAKSERSAMLESFAITNPPRTWLSPRLRMRILLGAWTV